MGQNPLPNNRQIFEVSPKQIETWRKLITESMIRQGYKDGPWFYKGAKCCLVWYLWHKAFPAAKWIIVRREDKDIARSCLKTRFMRAFRDEQGWLNWVQEHKKRFAEMHMAELSIFEFWPSEIVKGDFSTAKEMMGFLGLPWEEKLCRSFIDPALYAKLHQIDLSL